MCGVFGFLCDQSVKDARLRARNIDFFLTPRPHRVRIKAKTRPEGETVSEEAFMVEIYPRVFKSNKKQTLFVKLSEAGASVPEIKSAEAAIAEYKAKFFA